MTSLKQLKGIQIEYLLSGESNSETILFVHGLGANLSQFENQQKYFGFNYKVLSINLRGHGRSTISGELKSTDLELQVVANDIIELLDILDITKVHYVGNSMGGNIGFEILNSRPDLLQTLTIFGTTGELKTSRVTLRIVKTIHLMLTPIVRGNLSKIAGCTKASKAKIKEMMIEVSKSTIIAALPVLADFNYLKVIRASKTPCLIIKGKRDTDINKTIKSTINAFKNRGNFELYEMKDAGHFANLDNPDLFNKVMAGFIKKYNSVNRT